MTPLFLNVAELRRAKGWTQLELARRSGVPQPTISRIEARLHGAIAFDVLERLADALGVHPKELVQRQPRAARTRARREA